MKYERMTFIEDAKQFIVRYLQRYLKASGEVITNAAKESGLSPDDDRAFGPAFRSLSVRGVIKKCGTCKRHKGHRSSGGSIWRLKN